MNQPARAFGDFTGLASAYAGARPGYARPVVRNLLRLCGKPPELIHAADVGAGTGIFSRILLEEGCGNVTAVEPNADMRAEGEKAARANLTWRDGSAEKTGLAGSSVDLLTMASSFHWADFDAAVKEFCRVLKPGGLFAALWNPRDISVNLLLTEVEAELVRLKPDLKRRSSGRSAFTDMLLAKLNATGLFEDVMYMEAMHFEPMSQARYMEAWRSVNDIQVQLGPQLFEEFLEFTARKISHLDVIDCAYTTRCWVARATR